jgi:beta-galactosidase
MDRRDFIAATGTTLASLFAFAPGHFAWAAEDSLQGSSAGKAPLLFGTDYYPDQTPEHLWQEDAVAMAATGITNVRLAEFAWALMEPQEGKFDFAWLQRAVKLLHEHDIAVILGTPSAAPPPWLSQKYPEILMVDEHGVTQSPGTRRFTCPTNQTYRRLSLSIATEMTRAFASMAGVIGWQIDNELALGNVPRCYCQYCRAGFQKWLRTRYGTLDAINQKWGTVFWSNTYTDFSQIPVPLPSGSVPNPGFALDYDRYQSDANISFLEEQLAILRQLCPNHFVTTNNVGGVIDTIDFRGLYRKLDFVSSDNYPGLFEMFLGSADSAAAMPSWAFAPMISFTHDFMRSAKDGKPFLIMEEQSSKGGQTTITQQPEPGQLRLWSYQAVAHGAMGINYFRWDTALTGGEEYWHGMLKHDRSHSPGFDELKQTIAELKSLGQEALHAPCAAEIALCFDPESDWALGIQPGQAKLKYLNEFLPWYGALSASHAGIDIVDATGDLSRYKVLCAPLMYIVTAEQAERIRTFVQNGGTFISGFRLGVKDRESRIVDTPLPGLLRDVMGVELFDYQPIYSQKQHVKFSGSLTGPDAECHIWADVLEPKQAEMLASYTGGDYEGKAAITLNKFGKGKAIYIGPRLEPQDLGRVLLTLLPASGVYSPISAPQGVEVTRRQDQKTEWIYFLNHTSTAQTVQARGGFTDIITNTKYTDSIPLERYGVRVLQRA